MKKISLTQGKCIDCGNPVLKVSQKPSKRCSGCLLIRRKELNKLSQARYRNAHRERVLASSKKCMRKARLRNPTQAHIKDRALSLKKNYGITIETYEKMFMSQKGVCAVCEKPEPSHKGYLCVDHNHIVSFYIPFGKLKNAHSPYNSLAFLSYALKYLISL